MELSRFGLQKLWRPNSRFINTCFVCWILNFLLLSFYVLDNFKALTFSLSSFIYFSYFSFFVSFVCDNLRDGEIPCLRKRLNGRDDRSLSCIFLLLGLGLVFIKLALFSGARAVD